MIEERKEVSNEITQGEYITLLDKQQETVHLKLLKDSFVLEVRRAFDSLIWKGEFTMDGLVKQDSKWSISLEDITEVAAFIKYSFENDNYTFQISGENKALFSFEIDMGFKKKHLVLSIEPKTKDTEETLNEHAQILRELTDRMGNNQGTPPDAAEAVADLTNRITRIEGAPIAFHKVFRLREGSWTATSTAFVDFTNARGEFDLTYPAFIKWELQMNGCHTNGYSYAAFFHLLRLKFSGEQDTFSPDETGIKFRAGGLNSGGNYNYDHNDFFSDVIELNPHNYQVQMQIAINTSQFMWNSAYGEINLQFIIYPRFQ